MNQLMLVHFDLKSSKLDKKIRTFNTNVIKSYKMLQNAITCYIMSAYACLYTCEEGLGSPPPPHESRQEVLPRSPPPVRRVADRAAGHFIAFSSIYIWPWAI